MPIRLLFYYVVFLLPCLCNAQSDAYNEVIRVSSKVEVENRFVGSLDETALNNLPIGVVKTIGQARYIIAIDSAIFLPDGAFFNAYMCIEYPGTNKKIAFAAKRIRFNPAGVVGGLQSRLVLVSTHQFAIGPHAELHLLPNNQNYVEWNCDGFSGMHLDGNFVFSSQLLKNASQPNEPVQAHFSLFTEDLHNAFAALQFSPFTLNGLDDFVFTVSDAVVDWSASHNAPNMVFPVGYTNGTSALWTGFYLKSLQLKLPSEFDKNGNPCSIEIHNLLIDDEGLSGIFSANQILSLQEGSMQGWGFSLEELSLQFVKNNLSGGSLQGRLQLPIMDSTQALRFSALVFYNDNDKKADYSFSVQAENNLEFSVLAAKVDLYPSSQLQIIRQQGQLRAEAILNGKIQFGHENFSTGKIAFQQLTIVPESPYISNGVFALSSNQSSTAANYPISMDSLYLEWVPTGPKIACRIRLNMMENAAQNFSASTVIKIETQINEDYASRPLSFKSIAFAALQFNVNTVAFKLNGQIQFHQNDPVYGKGFFGQLSLSIPDIIEPGIAASVCFGKTSFRYFAVDAFIPAQLPIPGTPLRINRLLGGLSYKMRPQKSSASQYVSSLYQNPTSSFTQYYIPDASIGVGFKAGIGFAYIPNEKTCNGDAMLELLFSSSGGIYSVKFIGNAYFLSTVEERKTKPPSIQGQIVIDYLHQDKIFDATLSIALNINNALVGNGQAKIHFDPQTWLVCIGRPSQPLNLSIVNLASGSAYVMTGKQLEPMPAPPAPLASLVASMGLDQLRNTTALENASGFACGFRFGSSLYRELGWDNFAVYGAFAFGAGFDMMLANYGSSAHCSGSTEVVGMNGWVVQGQLFAYLQCAVGIKGRFLGSDFDIEILNGSVATLLGGKLPKPTYLYGGVNVSFTILSVIHGSFNFNFECGTNCSIVNG